MLKGLFRRSHALSLVPRPRRYDPRTAEGFWRQGEARGRFRVFNALSRGMTLVEIMVVVVIISLVVGVVGVSVFNTLTKAQRKVAYTQIKQIGEALDLYKLSFHNYPSTAEGLNALVTPKGNEKPIMPQVPKDPWGHDYVYVYPGASGAGTYDLMSYGPDGVQGGGDDITNLDNPEGKKE
jgi:general secretion pathway protein G